MSAPLKNAKQLQFFELLKDTVPSTVSIADEMADLFGVSKNSIYRRMSGETLITLDETVLICEHFKVPIELLSSSGKKNVTFVYESFGAEELDINGYLTNIISILQHLVKKPGIHIYFAAEFVPVFHHFEFEEMTAFKFFYWQKSIVNDKHLEDKKFEFNAISKETLQLSKKALELYSQIPSTEIWNVETINSTLMQILYYWDAGLFQSKEDALLICEQMRLMVEKVRQEAEEGSKFFGTGDRKITSAAFNMYGSDVIMK